MPVRSEGRGGDKLAVLGFLLAGVIDLSAGDVLLYYKLVSLLVVIVHVGCHLPSEAHFALAYGKSFLIVAGSLRNGDFCFSLQGCKCKQS